MHEKPVTGCSNCSTFSVSGNELPGSGSKGSLWFAGMLTIVGMLNVDGCLPAEGAPILGSILEATTSAN